MMDLYTVSEEAYKNGYAAGLVDGKKEAMKCVDMELLKDVLDAVAGCSGRHCDGCPYHKKCIDVLSHDEGILYRQIFGGVKAMITDMDCETADVQEVRHERWINESRQMYGPISAQCSVCELFSGTRLCNAPYKYCPHCGAKMDGDEE